MKIVIIIPTYNERENVGRMIETLAKVFTKLPHHLHVLYVDGNSPDGTADVIRQKQLKFPWLHLLVETEKAGMGRAYAKGMDFAMKNLKADFLGEMDGDFQHRPQDLPALVAKIDQGYDYIIGSRYIAGGSIPKEWGVDRKFLSVVGNLVARTIMLLPKIHDVTGGFRLSRVRGFMADFDFSTLLSDRFAYKVHLLYYMVNRGARFVEVPITFAHRTLGDSKIIKNDLFETLRVLLILQSRNLKMTRFLKFSLVGGFGLLLQTIVFETIGLRFKFLSPSLAAVAGGEIAIINNFTFNNLWTFREHRVVGPRLWKKFLQFNLTSLFSLGVQFVILRLGETVAQGSHTVIRAFYLAAIVVVLVINYSVYNLLIWKTTK